MAKSKIYTVRVKITAIDESGFKYKSKFLTGMVLSDRKDIEKKAIEKVRSMIRADTGLSFDLQVTSIKSTGVDFTV